MNAREGFLDAGQVVPSVSLENMLNQRAAVVGKVRMAMDLLAEARTIAIAAHVGFPRFQLEERRYFSIVEPDRIADALATVERVIDADAWQYLMRESGLRTFMDAKAREEWDKTIREGKAPALTQENLHATFRGLYASREDMFERGVIRCFKGLSWNYKTNLPFRFGKRIVLRCLRHEPVSGSALGSLNHRGVDQLDDLTRVMCVLDGKPEPDHRQGMYSVLGGIHSEPVAETAYLHVRQFKNGNGHITFKRPDLVGKLNQIIARHYPGALPAPKGAA